MMANISREKVSGKNVNSFPKSSSHLRFPIHSGCRVSQILFKNKCELETDYLYLYRDLETDYQSSDIKYCRVLFSSDIKF
jgi:hypothetical protein